MRKFLRFIRLKFREVWFQLALSISVNIITWLYIYAKIKPNSEIVPLHYNIIYRHDIIYGPESTGKGYYIYALPLSGLIILIVNTLLARKVFQKDEFASKILIAASIVVQIFIFIAVLYLRSVIVI